MNLRALSPARLLAAAVTAMALTGGAAASSALAQTQWQSCSSPQGFQCTTVSVPLDRSGAVAGTINLNAVRRTTLPTPPSTAVLTLAGGPGQPATPFAPSSVRDFKDALTTRDLLVFDQRGTGKSNPLSCRAFRDSQTSDVAAVGAGCAKELGDRRRFFTTNDSALDIEAVRIAGGYEKLTIYGVSYGTKVAMAYAAQFPDRVERLILDSVVTPEGPDPLQRSTFTAIPRVLKELCSRGECSGITNDVVSDLRAIVRRLQQGDIRGRAIDGRGRLLRGTINRQDLLDLLIGGDLNPTVRAELPAALATALRGDRAQLTRLVARGYGATYRQDDGEAGVNNALYAATTCEELPFPWERGANATTRIAQVKSALAALAPSVFFPFDRSTAAQSSTLELCEAWPTPNPAPAVNGTLPAVPTLVVNGTADLRTPLEDATAVTGRIAGAQLLAVPFTGHSVIGSENGSEQCGTKALAAFFANQPIVACTNDDNPFSPTPRSATTLQSVKPIPGAKGRVGRTIAAALATANDMRRQLLGITLEAGDTPSGIGGLRAGRSVVNRETGTQRLIRVQYVGGVSVTGIVRLTGAADLRVRGGGASAGRIRISAGARVIRATLGGRSLRLVPAQDARADADRLPTLEQARQAGRRARAAR